MVAELLFECWSEREWYLFHDFLNLLSVIDDNRGDFINVWGHVDDVGREDRDVIDNPVWGVEEGLEDDLVGGLADIVGVTDNDGVDLEDEADEIGLVFVDDFIEVGGDGLLDFRCEWRVDLRAEIDEVSYAFEERERFREVVAGAEEFLELIGEEIDEDVDFGETLFLHEANDVLLRF